MIRGTGNTSSECLATLSETEVQKRLGLPQTIEALDNAFRTRFDRFQMPPRLTIQGAGNRMLVMPCHSGDLFGIKIVTLVQRPLRGNRVLNASYTLYDAVSGRALLQLEADSLTVIRTAAASAVATRALAKPSAKILGIFGTGRIASAHVEALMAVRRFQRILVCGTSVENAQAFAFSVAERHRVDALMTTPDACVAESDVVCTCTTSQTPVFNGNLIGPGTHINAVGAFTPDTREVDSTTVMRARVVVDSYQGALREAGDLLLPLKQGDIQESHIVGDLHEVLTGDRVARKVDSDITLFKSVGCAMEDLVAAELVLNSWEQVPTAV